MRETSGSGTLSCKNGRRIRNRRSASSIAESGIWEEKPDSSKLPSPEDIEGFDTLNSFQAFGAANLKRLLDKALHFGVITEAQLKGAVADFGCGVGGSSWYLKRLGANVTALDLDDMAELKALAVLTPEKIVSGDGIKYLNELPESSLDMVLAVMYGPDTDGRLTPVFLSAARRAIKKDGSILVFSDIDTLRYFDSTAQGDSISLDNNSRFVPKESLGGGQTAPQSTTDEFFPQDELRGKFDEGILKSLPLKPNTTQRSAGNSISKLNFEELLKAIEVIGEKNVPDQKLPLDGFDSDKGSKH